MINLYLQDIYPMLCKGRICPNDCRLFPKMESKVKAGIIEFATPKKDIKVQLQAALRCEN